MRRRIFYHYQPTKLQCSQKKICNHFKSIILSTEKKMFSMLLVWESCIVNADYNRIDHGRDL